MTIREGYTLSFLTGPLVKFLTILAKLSKYDIIIMSKEKRVQQSQGVGKTLKKI